MNLYDKNGIPIKPCDILKVFHFIGIRNKNHYMYKEAMHRKTINDREFLLINHLNKENSNYLLLIDDRILPDYEIIQGYDGNEHFSGRNKKQ